MNFFLQNVRLLHPESVHHLQTIDIIIQDGRIQAMGPDLQAPPSTDFIRISQPDLQISWLVGLTYELPAMNPAMSRKRT